MTVQLDLRFDGLDADNHQLDMRLLGRSLIGLERVMSASLILAVEGRLPAKREQTSLVIRVRALHGACVELPTEVHSAAGVLPFIFEMIRHPGSKFLFSFLSFLLKWKGGKRSESEVHLMDAYNSLKEIHLATIEDRRDERSTKLVSEREWRDYSLALADHLVPRLKDVVAPVGPSAETLRLAPPPGYSATVLDVAEADAVRANEPLEVGDMETMTLNVDGITLHNRTLKVEDPTEPGRFVTAEVRDPAFDADPNIYKEAVGSMLTVDAKASRRPGGELAKLYIMNVSRGREAA